MDKFIVLDALRGAAAFSVITRHASGFFSYHLHYSYLAVDLFFILSGFVITHAYDKKLLTGELTVKKFVITRIIRLYPLYFVSVFLGAIAFFPWGKLVSGGELDQSPYILSFLAALMFLPYKMPNDNSLYPLVGVCWSLFYEIIINVFYAYFCNRLNKITSSLIVLILGISLLIVGLHSNSIDGGYSWGGHQLFWVCCVPPMDSCSVCLSIGQKTLDIILPGLLDFYLLSYHLLFYFLRNTELTMSILRLFVFL